MIKKNDYPTYINYAILFNNENKLETIEKYTVYNCESTMIFSIAQNKDIELNLTGFNSDSYFDIQNIIIELFKDFNILSSSDLIDEKILSEKLKIESYEAKKSRKHYGKY